MEDFNVSLKKSSSISNSLVYVVQIPRGCSWIDVRLSLMKVAECGMILLNHLYHPCAGMSVPRIGKCIRHRNKMRTLLSEKHKLRVTSSAHLSIPVALVQGKEPVKHNNRPRDWRYLSHDTRTSGTSFSGSTLIVKCSTKHSPSFDVPGLKNPTMDLELSSTWWGMRYKWPRFPPVGFQK